MSKIFTKNLTKKDICKLISKDTGLPNTYTKKILEDFIVILSESIKLGNLNIKNFGTFKLNNKNERIGRNPKSNINYRISSRVSLSFTASNNLKDKIRYI